MDAKDWITIGISAYAVVLTTILAVIGARRRRPRILLRIEPLPLPGTDWTQPAGIQVRTTLANSGGKPFVVSAVTIGILAGPIIADPRPERPIRLPYSLQPDSRPVQFGCMARELAMLAGKKDQKGTVKLIARCENPEGKTYTSKPVEFDIDVYLE